MFISANLTACSNANGDPIEFYAPVPHLMKLDSKADRFGLPGEAPDINRVESQKNKDIKSSYKLNGINELKSLDIVKEATITKDKIEVIFTVESMNKKNDEDKSITQYIWENALFLLYTITDTFPEIEDIRLQADYYYIDRYGKPYKEVVFIANTKGNVINKIDRYYFRTEMLEHLIDYYLAENLDEMYEKK